MKPSNYTLGLDMGVASLGWAIVSTDDRFIDAGVRVFPAGLDNFNSAKEKHPNIDRRSARGMRRRIRRKAERKALIRTILQELGWMPTDDSRLQSWMNLNVYELRSRAIAQKITLEELGRIILHLNQRRGFLSLRKTEESNADKETQGMLGEMSALQKAIDESGTKTLGNFLYHIYQEKGLTERIRARHIRRAMLHHEFDLIWNTQATHHKELSDTLRYGSHGKLENPTKVVTPVPRNKNESLFEQFGIENLTFFQRRVYWPASSIGQCELEPTEKRAPIADRRFQQFRMLQEVNNLRLLDDSAPGKPAERPLTEDERATIITYLTGKEKATFEAIKKHLCKNKKLTGTLPETHSQLSFNLESGGRKYISATTTDHKLASAKGYGKEWHQLDEDIKNKVVEALTLPAAIDEDIRSALEEIPGLSTEKIGALLKISLPTGYGHLSVCALEKLLPHVLAGMRYMANDESDSALHAAGYHRRDQKKHDTVKLLPSFNDLLDPNSKHYDPQQVEINNPVVRRALTELRKVVNGLTRKYGSPSRIHIEMARELKMSPKQRKDHQQRTRQFEKERDQARDALTKLDIIPNHDAIILYRLWKEQDKTCIYSGKRIGITQLFGSEIDIDHIYPFSNSADNSLANKVVCYAEENRVKGNLIPHDWLARGNPEKYEQVLQRAKKLPRGKFKRFISEEIPEGFVNRDLNDTSWMARAARQYLARILKQRHHILGIKGSHTATLRNQWELHSLLRNDGLNLKNRDDHRHHALDAIVIALCDQPRVQEITEKLKFERRENEAKEAGKRIYRIRTTGDKLSLPWPNFRLDVTASLNSLWVSHRPQRKLSGPLHKETNYGKTADGLLVVRKSVKDLSRKEVEGIRDPAIYQLIKTYITENGGDIACLKELSDDNPLTMSSGIPVKKVRTAIPYAHITLRKGTPHETHVQSASTHHVAIFSLGDGKFHFEPVTLYEAACRKRAKEAIIQKQYVGMPPEAEYQFHLCSGDSMMATIDGKERLFVFKGIHATQLTAKFIHHTDARKNNQKDPETGKAVSIQRTSSPNKFEENFPNAHKVNILPTGEIQHAR